MWETTIAILSGAVAFVAKVVLFVAVVCMMLALILAFMGMLSGRPGLKPMEPDEEYRMFRESGLSHKEALDLQERGDEWDGGSSR